jgi:hypothetical protein
MVVKKANVAYNRFTVVFKDLAVVGLDTNTASNIAVQPAIAMTEVASIEAPIEQPEESKTTVHAPETMAPMSVATSELGGSKRVVREETKTPVPDANKGCCTLF